MNAFASYFCRELSRYESPRQPLTLARHKLLIQNTGPNATLDSRQQEFTITGNKGSPFGKDAHLSEIYTSPAPVGDCWSSPMMAGGTQHGLPGYRRTRCAVKGYCREARKKTTPVHSY